ncbi:transmembrane protein 208 [Trichonephila inaurata madagascariensis]|uniref:Transmembrane protein 208 n=1 Tax=Trichonephila inaurata madagascariensis TaxID=2747483 RepID=A0A8X6I597_9ARAC|nr:transmembrane protein 208 [Trichonephila inaurata madagascariensis]
MAPQKGKQGTKGQKQIVEENKQTLKFYTIMAVSAEVIYNGLMLTFFWESYSALYMCLVFASILVYAGCLQFMWSMAKATYSETGQLLDGGIDLNMEAGFAENLKDLIILTASIQVLSVISNFFWLLWFLAPVRAFYMLWVNILAPWIFSPSPEIDEKKQKKMERKAKRR